MSFYVENVGRSSRILELLSQPVSERCTELSLLFDRCSVREMHDLFPVIVNSIFELNSGGLGWGLRSTCREISPIIFEILHDFFVPHGPMFRLCYRLINDAIKFEFNVEFLPHKSFEMLQNGQYSIFYSELVNIDPFRRCVTSLSLNAFDYFILNFAVHGTFSLQKHFANALQVHNERMKTVYFYLSAQYFCTFLPGSPDQFVIPISIRTTIKVPQPIPTQQLQPKRSPKYLKIPNVTPYSSTNNQDVRSAESPRSYAWRTESVLHMFIDTWLRYDADEALDLPSSEFIRVIRIMVKQIHTFSNCAALDTTPMAALRKMSQLMMKARIFSFLKSIINRWPLDSSLSVVLELWLSYIQPWRYTLDWRNHSQRVAEMAISSQFESFIQDNLVIYTQIFHQILSRFNRLDFTTVRNVIMLHRLVKVFSQPFLPQKLFDFEQILAGNNAFGMALGVQQLNRQYLSRLDSNIGEWDNFFNEDSYIPLFSQAVKCEIGQFIKTVYTAKMYVQQEICMIRINKIKRKSNIRFFTRIINFFFDDMSPTEIKLQEIIKIPGILDLALQTLSKMFDVSIPEISIAQLEPKDQSYADLNVSLYDNSGYLDTLNLSPNQMKNNVSNIKSTIDPALLPIQNDECSVLVRFLHQLSCKLNVMFSEEMQNLWNRSDVWGSLSQQILSPPMTAQWFDKPGGVSQLYEDHLPPRICLRRLASFKTLILVGASLFVGHLLWGSPSYGLLSLLLLRTAYMLIVATI